MVRLDNIPLNATLHRRLSARFVHLVAYRGVPGRVEIHLDRPITTTVLGVYDRESGVLELLPRWVPVLTPAETVLLTETIRAALTRTGRVTRV
ncbi:hypothetical protein STSO111631_19445 [Stackebrandtia soli]